MAGWRAMAVVTALAAAGAIGPSPAAAAVPAGCVGALPGAFPAPAPRDLRFGINPHVQAGQFGAGPASALPEDRGRQVSSLRLLAGTRPFVLRLSRVFWPDTAAQRAALDQEIADYSAAGFLIELQLRYHPTSSSPANPAQFAAWVAEVVHTYDSRPALVSVQVTNEVNFRASGDSSDGQYAGAEDALIQGVERGKAQAQADGVTGRLKVGFNWFYRTDDAEESAFWNYLHDHGGAALVAATDWIGLDAYPGTFFPPEEAGPNGFYNGMVNAFSTLRNCYLSGAGFSSNTPIYIEETGYPTNPDRPPVTQVEALREIVRASRDYAGVYNLTDFRWFNLRDADSSPSPNFQQHFGLMYSDYTPKPAFAAYRQLLAGDTTAAPGPTPAASSSSSSAASSPAAAAVLPPTRGARGSSLALLLGLGFLGLLLLAGAVATRRALGTLL